MKFFKVLFKPFTYVFIISALMLSCADDGEPGPAGDKGDQGEQGIQGENGDDGEQGATGEDGEDGEDGNANVVYSEWITATYTTELSGKREQYKMPTTDLTQQILDQGVILVYGKLDNSSNDVDDEVWAIPALFPFLNQTYSFNSNSLDEIKIFCDASDGTDFGTPYLDSFRYVIIPSSATTGGRMENVDLTKMSYEEVMDHFDLAY